ncbi:MAG: LamG domain-containing protein, partial [Bacteroidales bacterium]|nr:LamG domain-containing protein [Bacteroidales bacterium]
MKKILTFIAICLFLTNLQAQQSENSLNFDGVDDYVSFGDNDGMSAITIETWIFYMDDGLKFICSKGANHLEIHTVPGGNLRFIPADLVFLDAINVLPVNQWTHIACVYDPSVELAKIYINGIEVPVVNNGTNPLTTSIADNITNFEIGRRTDNFFYFQGNIDEFRIWNVARTEQEIYDNYKRSIDVGSQTGLISYYDFNQGIAGGNNTGITSLTDLTGNFNGTLNNFLLNGLISNFVDNFSTLIPEVIYSEGLNGEDIPDGWSVVEVVNTDGEITFVTTSSYPIGFNPPEGTHFACFNSYHCIDGSSVRLQQITPISTTNFNNISINFDWTRDNQYSEPYDDLVYIQWSTDGITWNNAGSVKRYYDLGDFWTIQSINLPPETNNLSNLYIGFLFVSRYGNDCHLDNIVVKGYSLLPQAGDLTFSTTDLGSQIRTATANTYDLGEIASTDNLTYLSIEVIDDNINTASV